MKKNLLQRLIQTMKDEMAALEAAALANKAFATDQEFKAESKYDTRSLEASYLAGAEAKRVEDLKLEIQMLEEVDVDSSDKNPEIGIGSIVELLYQNQKRSYFLIPTAGGTMLDFEGKLILVVSVFSPLGAAMLGLGKGDYFEVETPKESRTYQVSNLS